MGIEKLILPTFNLLHFISGFFLFVLAFYSYRHKHYPTGWAMCGFFFLMGYWSFFAGLIYLVDDFETKVTLHRLRSFGPIFIPSVVLYLLLKFNQRIRLSQWVWGLVLIIPVLSFGLTFSPFFEYYNHSHELLKVWGGEILYFQDGPFFKFQNIHARLAIVFGLIVFLASPTDFRARGKFRKGLIFSAIFIPFIADSIAVFYFEELRYIQITPTVMSLTSFMMLYAVFSEHLLKEVPFARSLALDNTADIHLVFNRDFQLVDFNSSAALNLNLKDTDLFTNISDTITRFNLSGSGEVIIGQSTFEKITKNLRDVDGTVVGSHLVLHDITLQRKLHRELEEVSRVKTQLLGVMGHDLQTHLSSLSLLSEDLTKHYDKYSREDIKAHAENIFYASRNCVDFVDQMITWSKFYLVEKKLHRSDVEVNQLLTEIIDFYMPILQQRNLEIRVNNKFDGHLYTDKNMLQVILRNLLSNAVKFSYEESEIIMTVSNSSLNGISSVTFSVQDFGPGTVESELENIMSKEVQSVKGFGLFVSKEFTGYLNGVLDAQCDKGQGCTFSLTLPLVDRKS